MKRLIVTILILATLSAYADKKKVADVMTPGMKKVDKMLSAKKHEQKHENNKLILKLTESAYNSINEINNRSRSFGLSSIDVALHSQLISKIIQLHPAPKNTNVSSKRRSLEQIFQIEYYQVVDINKIIKEVNKLNDVIYCEPVFIYSYDAAPDDYYYNSLFFLDQISAEDAWDIHKGEDGSTEVVIGICDSGVEWFHSDLVDNLYQNLGEDYDGDGSVIEYVGGEWRFDTGDINGVDDDGNGYTDDFVGWNFYTGDGTSQNNPNASSYNTHGTHVAGIAAGVTNNDNGIASISWNVSFLPTKHGNNSYNDPGIYNGYSGIVYLADMGVDVINCSWGGYGYSSYGADIVSTAVSDGVVIIAAAGNGDTDNFHYPSAYPGVISVASVASNDSKAYYSEYGISIDIAVPGGDYYVDDMIYSTIPGNSYSYMQGTSMASPLATGAFALLKSYRNTWSNSDLIQQFLGSADNIDDDNPNYEGLLGYGRLNMYNALNTNDANISTGLRLDLTNFTIYDENSNGVIEKGENIDISFTLTNYNPLYGSDDLDYSVTCTDEDITVNNGTGSTTIDEDGGTATVTTVNFDVANDAPMKSFRIELDLSSTDGIDIGDNFFFDLLIFDNEKSIDVYAYNAYDPFDDYPVGIISFYTGDPLDITLLADQSGSNFLAAATWFNNRWYSFEYYDNSFLNVNTSDYSREYIGSIDNTITGMAFDPTTDVMYGLEYIDGTYYLVTVNISSGETTSVGSLGSGVAGINLACDSEGNLYTIDMEGDSFGQINKSTGAYTSLFDLNGDFLYAQDMEYDHVNDLLYVAAYGTDFDSYLGIVDIDNELIGKVGNFTNGMEVTALAIPNNLTFFTLITPAYSKSNVPLLPYFEWFEVVEADMYKIIVSTNSDLSSPIISTYIEDTEYSSSTQFSTNTTYYWKVIAYQDDEILEQSSIWEFSTGDGNTYDYSLLNALTEAYSGTYSSISGTSIGNGDDEQYSVNIPFDFIYDNTDVTSLYVSTNGYLAFNASPSMLSQDFDNTLLMCSPIHEDLIIDENGDISYIVTGTAPNRVLTIQFDNVDYYGGSDADLDFQIKLYEGSNEIKFVYGDITNLGMDDNVGWCYWSGNGLSEFINVDPASGPAFMYSDDNFDTSAWMDELSAEAMESGDTYRLYYESTNSIVLISPADGTEDVDDVFLRWTVLNNATSYTLQIATDENMSNVVYESSVYTNKKNTSDLNLSYPQTYFWRVKATTSGGDTEWTDVWEFTTNIREPKIVNVTLYLDGLWDGTTHKKIPVSVELREGVDLISSTLVSVTSGLINESGVVSVDFKTVEDGDYWLVVRTAGYLPLGSTSKVSVSTDPASYNFTDASSKAAGGTTALKLLNGDYVLRSGDFNFDRRVYSSDIPFLSDPFGKNLRPYVPEQ